MQLLAAAGFAVVFPAVSGEPGGNAFLYSFGIIMWFCRIQGLISDKLSACAGIAYPYHPKNDDHNEEDFTGAHPDTDPTGNPRTAAAGRGSPCALMEIDPIGAGHPLLPNTSHWSASVEADT